jgi:hypothetical protein
MKAVPGLLPRQLERSENVKAKRETVHRSPFAVRRSPFAVRRSPFTVHRSPFTVHRSPFAVHRSPFAVWGLGFGVWRAQNRRHKRSLSLCLVRTEKETFLKCTRSETLERSSRSLPATKDDHYRRKTTQLEAVSIGSCLSTIGNRTFSVRYQKKHMNKKMKIVVIGGSGLIGKKLVNNLRQQGHAVVAASPSSGVNTLTGEALENLL